MSGRYSHSPALQLTIGKSRLRAALYAALCFATFYALWGIHARGYPLTCLLFAPFSVALLWRLRHDPMAGAQLCWRQGRWTLQQGSQMRVIRPSPRSTAAPWVIYLSFIEVPAGRAGQLWVYVDSASPQQWRLLRVRLALL